MTVDTFQAVDVLGALRDMGYELALVDGDGGQGQEEEGEDRVSDDRYPVESLDEDEDDGTMPDNVAELERAVVGRRIVSAEKMPDDQRHYGRGGGMLVLTLDDGTRVKLCETSDCCAFTDLEGFLLHADRIDHAILGVGTTEGYTKWHIYADLGDVLEMDVAWSCGNPFYYGYGFDIAVEPVSASGEGER